MQNYRGVDSVRILRVFTQYLSEHKVLYMNIPKSIYWQSNQRIVKSLLDTMNPLSICQSTKY